MNHHAKFQMGSYWQSQNIRGGKGGGTPSYQKRGLKKLKVSHNLDLTLSKNTTFDCVTSRSDLESVYRFQFLS